MEVFNGINYGTYSTFRVMGINNPELAEIMRGSAIVGGYLWMLFLAILVWRWWSILGRFPYDRIAIVLLLIAIEYGLQTWLDRPRPIDAEDFFGKVVGQSFPNGPTFRAVLISALMWETSKPGWGRWLGLLGAVLYCVWVMMGQLITHLGFLTDVLASLFLALGIGFLSPRLFGPTPSTPAAPSSRGA